MSFSSNTVVFYLCRHMLIRITLCICIYMIYPPRYSILTIDETDTNCTGDFEFSYTISKQLVIGDNLINLLLAFHHRDKRSLMHQRILPRS